MSTTSLRTCIEDKLNRWNERSMFTMCGTKNLSRADMDTLLICCDWYEQNGSLHGLSYFSPGVCAVLAKHGLL